PSWLIVSAGSSASGKAEVVPRSAVSSPPSSEEPQPATRAAQMTTASSADTILPRSASTICRPYYQSLRFSHWVAPRRQTTVVGRRALERLERDGAAELS